MLVYGIFLGNIFAVFLQANPALTSLIGNACSNISIGLYAGNNRKDIREFAELDKNCDDCLIHTFCSPCAICEETIALNKYQTTNNYDLLIQESPPSVPEMTK